jgi:ferritin
LAYDLHDVNTTTERRCTMKIIAKLCDMIEEELCDSEKYIRCALEHKDTDKSLADTFYKLSVEEMNHMSMLHKQVVEKIEAFRKTQGEPPQSMMAVYDYLHKRQIEKSKEIKVMQEMYNN